MEQSCLILLNFLNCPQRVHLDIQVGEHANDYAEIAAKDKLSELQLRVRQLVEQVEQIQKEQNYQRVRGWAGSGGLLPRSCQLTHPGAACQIHYETQGTYLSELRCKSKRWDDCY